MHLFKPTPLLLSLLIISGQTIHAQDDSGINSAEYAAYNNFDFISGKKVLFFDDFSSGHKNWQIIEFDKSDEVEAPGIRKITNDETPWLKTPRRGIFYPQNIKTLPEDFTIEFDLWADIDKMSEMESGLILAIVGDKVNKNEYSTAFDENPQIQLDIHPSRELLYCIATKENTDGERVLDSRQIHNGWKPGTVHRISISKNKTHVKVFVNEKKFIDLPGGLPQKANYTLLLATNMWGDGLYFSNFKVAEGMTNHPAKLDSEHKFVTNAIYFNVNSASIKPESWPALNMAATAIRSTEGPVIIIGHTDSDGNDSDNLLLSRKRAEAVKSFLVKQFGIDAARLLTDGKGEAEPIDPKNTAEAKATNRRVEFIKQK